MLELAGGMSTAMLIMKDLGWRIGLWHTSEIDPSAMAVSAAVAARAGVTTVDLGDLMDLAEADLETEYDDVFASPPCRQFSSVGSGMVTLFRESREELEYTERLLFNTKAKRQYRNQVILVGVSRQLS